MLNHMYTHTIRKFTTNSFFLVLDILLLFYIYFFESILPPLFILIGLIWSSNKVRAKVLPVSHTNHKFTAYLYLQCHQ